MPCAWAARTMTVRATLEIDATVTDTKDEAPIFSAIGSRTSMSQQRLRKLTALCGEDHVR